MSEETTEPSYPPAPPDLCDAVNPDGTVRCALGKGHGRPTDGTPPHGEKYDHAAPSLGVWWFNPPALPDAFTACDATIKNGFDETVRCGLPAGHSPNRGGDEPGAPGFYDHTGQTAAGVLLWWRDTAADAVPSTFPAGNPAGDPLPRREPGAALNCVELSSHGDMCTLTHGHEGMHERHWMGKRVASWATTPQLRCESRPVPGGWATPVDRYRCELKAGHDGEHRDGPLSWRAGIGGPTLNPQPVRMRVVDLPSVPANPGAPVGIMTAFNVMRPGGFALVVDRFRDQAHRDAEYERWERHADSIGAKALILYVGTLDIEPVDWE